MNILEAFIKKNKSIVIFISGINIELLNKIGDTLSHDLNIPIIKISDYIKNSFFTNKETIDTCKLLKIMDKQKSYILVGFINPTNKQKYTFQFNIKFNSEYFMTNKIKNSKEIYEYYKSILKTNKIDKFFKYTEKNEETINNIFNHIIENISNMIYKQKSIFKEDKSIETKLELEKDRKSNENRNSNKDRKSNENRNSNKDRKSNKKFGKNKNWDKDNLYIDIDKYNDEMLNIEVHKENDIDDEDLFNEFEDDLYSPVRKLYFINDSYYKNFKGGRKKVISGRRYIDN